MILLALVVSFSSTYFGMVQTFEAMESGAAGKVEVLADGIYTALYGTAFGMLIPVPISILAGVLVG